MYIMNIIELFDELKKKDVHLSLKEDDTIKLTFNGSIPEDLLQEIRARKIEIIELLKNERPLPITKIKEKESYDLSDHQRRIWILSQLYESASSAYNIFDTYSFVGSFDLPKLKNAILAVIERHEILRTVFIEDKNGRPKQVIIDSKKFIFKVETHDLRNSSDAKGIYSDFLTSDNRKAFNLSKGPLIRVHLFQMGDEELIIYVNFHHIVADSRSLGVFFNDVKTFYNSFLLDSVPNIEPLRIQYKDYANYQLDSLGSKKIQGMKTYWSSVFAQGVPEFDLPFIKSRPEHKTFTGLRMEFNFSKELTSDLKNFCKKNNSTLFSALLASMKSLFYRYSGQSDIVVGSPFTSRSDADLENQIGYYSNTVVLRTSFSGQDDFITVLSKASKTILEARNNGEYPFINLVEDLKIERKANRNALVNILVALQNELGASTITNINDNEINCVINRGEVQTRLDVDFSFEEYGDILNLLVEFNTNLYDSEFIEKFILNYRNFIEECITNPSTPIDQINFVDEEEKNYVLELAIGKSTNFNKEMSIIEVFNDRCNISGDSVALEDWNGKVSYNELNNLSNQLANFLSQAKGINEGGIIILKLEKSNWHVIAQLAILKLKNAYIPVGSNVLEHRISEIKKNDLINFTLDQSVMDEFISGANMISNLPQNLIINGSDLAYIMYTSGSIDSPKGVMITHSNVIRLAVNGGFCDLNRNTTILSTAPFSFDAATFEVYGTLLNGGKLILEKEESLLDIRELTAKIISSQVNTMWLTGGWLNQLIGMDSCIFSHLDTLIAGGEALHSDKIKEIKLKYPNLKIINGYGPTENCTFSLTSLCSNIDFETIVPIGAPLNNSCAYILDSQSNLMPFGAIGEICLGGEGLSLGYFNNSSLTDEKFFANPFKKGTKLYRSGDLGRYRTDGLIEFLGRMDDQLKIRGFRVELEEIKDVFKMNKFVKDTVLLINDRNQELTAFITVEDDSPSCKEISSFLATYLPDYMIPSQIVKLEKFPLTKNGKVDGKTLLKDLNAKTYVNEDGIVLPKNEKEKLLLSLWKETLKLDQISIKSNFFEIGGDSIKLIDLTSKMSKYFDVSYSSLGKFTDNLTIEELSVRLIELGVIA